MGLFVDRRGHYRGWLASFLCCCAALTEDEYPHERANDHSSCTSPDYSYGCQYESLTLNSYHSEWHLPSAARHKTTAQSPYDLFNQSIILRCRLSSRLSSVRFVASVKRARLQCRSPTSSTTGGRSRARSTSGWDHTRRSPSRDSTKCRLEATHTSSGACSSGSSRT